MNAYTDIISAAELLPILDRCVVLDCRSKLGDTEWGRNAYLAGHIKGAQFADLDKDLAAAPGSQGRHPLPDTATWLATVQRFGINDGQQVVVYDDAGGAFAARAWWMLRWLGHAAVAVLDGGLGHWSGPTEQGPAKAVAVSDFAAKDPLTRSISSADLHQAMQAGTAPILVDARAQPRWAGIEEPIDPVAGHIPGAHCYPFTENLRADGTFKSPDELRTRFNAPGATVVCYCGSGVTAAHNILAMHIAGLPEPILYADSWSGWITDPARPIGTA